MVSTLGKIAGAALIFGSIMYTTAIKIPQTLIDRDMARVASCVEKEIEEVISEQERILGIKYNQNPNITFEDGEGYFGSYHSKDKRINISRRKYYDVELGNQSGCGLSLYPEKNRKISLREILGHELGHYSTDEIDNKTKNSQEQGLFNKRDLGAIIIGEGIGEYFGKISVKKEIACNKKNLEVPEEAGNYIYLRPEKFMYEVGYCLVKPIMDKFKAKGLEYLTKNSPEDYELTDLEEYQKRVYYELDQELNQK